MGGVRDGNYSKDNLSVRHLRKGGKIIRQTVPYVGDGDSRSVASREVDMCEDCRMKFREVIWDYFVETGDYGIIVKKKF